MATLKKTKPPPDYRRTVEVDIEGYLAAMSGGHQESCPYTGEEARLWVCGFERGAEMRRVWYPKG